MMRIWFQSKVNPNTHIYVETNEITAADGMPGLEPPRLLAFIMGGRGRIARIYVYHPEPLELPVPEYCTIPNAKNVIYNFFKTHKS